jgi:hypothetical protein
MNGEINNRHFKVRQYEEGCFDASTCFYGEDD